MKSEEVLENRIRRALIPVTPRKGYAAELKARLLSKARMPVEVEQHLSREEIVTIATVGIGALATLAAVTTIGVKFASLVGSGAILFNAATKQRAPRGGVRSQTA